MNRFEVKRRFHERLDFDYPETFENLYRYVKIKPKNKYKKYEKTYEKPTQKRI